MNRKAFPAICALLALFTFSLSGQAQTDPAKVIQGEWKPNLAATVAKFGEFEADFKEQLPVMTVKITDKEFAILIESNEVEKIPYELQRGGAENHLILDSGHGPAFQLWIDQANENVIVLALGPQQIVFDRNSKAANPAAASAMSPTQKKLIGKWRPNLEESEKRFGKFDDSVREVLSVIVMEFGTDGISLLAFDEPVSLSINQELVTPNESYELKPTTAADVFELVLTDEKGVRHNDKIQFLGEKQISVTLGGKNGHPIVLDLVSASAKSANDTESADTNKPKMEK